MYRTYLVTSLVLYPGRFMNPESQSPFEDNSVSKPTTLKAETEFTLSAMRCAASHQSHEQLLESYMKLARDYFMYMEGVKVLLAHQWGIKP